MIRRIAVLLFLFTLACTAQVPVSADLNRRIERQVRSTYNIPPYVTVEVGARKASSEFSGYDTVTIKMSYGDKNSSHDFLVSKDDKTLISLTKIDLTKDPYADTMSKIDLTGRPMRGAKDAKVTVVVYDDFQCPFCSKMHQDLFDDVLKTYGDRVKVYYKDFPLFDIHPWAGRAAIDSNCLGKMSAGAYWDFADYVHANGKSISGEKRPVEAQFAELDRVATDVGKRHAVDANALAACLKEQPREALNASVKEGEALGIQGTPAVFVNGVRLEGYVPAAQFKAVLDQALRDAGGATPAAAKPESK